MKVVPRERSRVLWDGALVFLPAKGGEKMNLTSQMLPGLSALLVGAVLTFFAGGLTRKPENANRIRLIGVALAFVGAIMVFIV